MYEHTEIGGRAVVRPLFGHKDHDDTVKVGLLRSVAVRILHRANKLVGSETLPVAVSDNVSMSQSTLAHSKLHDEE